MEDLFEAILSLEDRDEVERFVRDLCTLSELEAMAHRRAVVAANAGGLPDKVKPGVNGWLVEPGDASALAAAISGAIDEPKKLAAFGQAGRRIVEDEFSWDAAGRATLALYRELLA